MTSSASCFGGSAGGGGRDGSACHLSAAAENTTGGRPRALRQVLLDLHSAPPADPLRLITLLMKMSMIKY